MDGPRAARYVDKIAHAHRRLAQVEAWLGDARKDERSALATFKAFQEAAEAAADLAAMACVDAGRPARDDYANFARLAELGVVPVAIVKPLEEATGLRNRLVHEYDGVDPPRAFEAIARLAPAIASFLREVESWLSKTT